MTYKTTSAHFAIFKKECLYWIKRFGLTDWETRFKHGDLKRDKDFYAQMFTAQEPRLCVLRLCKKWVMHENSAELNTETIKKYALHEVLHQLLSPLYCHATMRYTVKEEIDEAEHVVIQRLVNTFMEQK